MKRIIELDGRSIEYDLERKNVKNLNLRIKADQSVYVSANRKVSEKTIQYFLQSKSDYILKAYIKEGYNTIQLLADKFDLSTSAVRYRVYKLGLISEY